MSASVMELMREMAKQVYQKQKQERRLLGFFSSHRWQYSLDVDEENSRRDVSYRLFSLSPLGHYPGNGEGNGQCIVGTCFGMETFIKICA
jgi:hypothetical protein